VSLKDDYLAQMNSQLKKWDGEMDKLTAKTHELGAEARAKYQAQLDALRANRDAALKKMQEITTASESAWHEVSKGMTTVWDAMKAALEKAGSQFKK
jgi:predicted  nucleic acid-binding Zn-ribbon protein